MNQIATALEKYPTLELIFFGIIGFLFGFFVKGIRNTKQKQATAKLRKETLHNLSRISALKTKIAELGKMN